MTGALRPPIAIVVLDYSNLRIPGPYFGDRVWEHLSQLDGKMFEYIPARVVPFPDGSEKVVIEGSVRGKDVYVIHSLHAEPAQHVMLAAETADALKRSDSGEVCLFDLYNPYFRQDARRDREPITAGLIANLYEKVDIVFTVEGHFKQLAGLFGKLESLPMAGVLARYMGTRPKIYDLSNAVVIAPDPGGVQRAERFANILGVNLAYVHKTRVDGRRVDIIDTIGRVGRNAYIYDDIIATGGTTVGTANALKDRGASTVHAVAAHLGLYENAKERLREAGIRVLGTNTIPGRVTDADLTDGFDVVDIAPLVADVISHRAMGRSISRYFSERVENAVHPVAND